MGSGALRSGAGVASLRLVAATSRRLGLGSGSTAGGRVGLLLDPELLGHLGAGRTTALVSGTNGKTTTTRLLAEALRTAGAVASSSAGANLPGGIASALAADRAAPFAVLEVDEAYLGNVARELSPAVVVLLNLSRDQLDRVSEVRMVARRWREALATTTAVVVANADDPLVTWAAGTAPRTRFVAAGGLWRSDAHHCPVCDARLELPDASTGPPGGTPGDPLPPWSCRCGFARPETVAHLDGETLELADGRRLPLSLALPGRFNLANAALALTAAAELGVEPGVALPAVAAVGEVGGRFARTSWGEGQLRLLLAKNPAGWTELLELLRHGHGPVILGVNARVADGHDPSWLWDVPFELLAGRAVVATGDRRLDLAVRLRHAGVEHEVAPDPLTALAGSATLAGPVGSVDYVGNYTAFQDLRRQLDGGARPRGALVAPPRSRSDGTSPPGEGKPGTSPPGEGQPGTGQPGSSRSGAGRVGTPGRPSALRVVVVHPDLLGTYGDGGNGTVLADRASWRGLPVELVLAGSEAPLPASADLYCLGGGEDGPQGRSAEVLAEGALERAVGAGAVVLAVCAGYQILGRSFPGTAGRQLAGMGLLEVETARGPGRRAVGELLVEAAGVAGLGGAEATLTGFENHAGRTVLLPGASSLGQVRAGVGNDGQSDGAVQGRVFGTYLHGPLLARNPAFADALLALATGQPLAPLEDGEEQALRRERLAAARGGGPAPLARARALLRTGRAR